MKTVTVVHCWSAPRSRSTALLYSFEARGENECVAIDEPLYRDWLIFKGDTVARPYHRELVEGIPPAGSPPEEADVWKRELESLDGRIHDAVKNKLVTDDGGVVFCKHMAKHSFLYNFDKECTVEGVNIVHRHLLLIRDPVSVLASWGAAGGVHGNNPTSDEVGIVPLLSIYSKLESRVAAGQDSLSSTSSVVILDSDDLVADPGKPDLRTNCRTPAAIPSSLNSHTFPLNVVFSHYPRQRVPWKIFVPPYQLNMCHQ